MKIIEPSVGLWNSAAHPNAQIISNMIKKELESLGYEFN